MKKVFLVLFSLILICSVSFAYDVEANVNYHITYYRNNESPNNFLDTSYSALTVKDILASLKSDFNNESYIGAFNKLTSELESLGYKWLCYESDNVLWLIVNNKDYDVEYGFKKYSSGDTDNYYLGALYSGSGSTSIKYVYAMNNLSKQVFYYCPSSSQFKHFCYFSKSTTAQNIYDTNVDVYLGNSDDLSAYFVWDGESYFYKQGGNDSTLPDLTDEQIAEIVERFINSDAYLEKAYYNGDYFITYDNLTGYFRGYSYSWNIDLAIEYGNYNDEGEFITTGTKEGEAYRIRPYEFSGDIFNKFGDWLASKFNTYAFEYFSIYPDSSIKPRYIGSLEHNYCSNYKENEVVIYSSKQIRYVGEETNSEGKTETVVTDNYIPPTVLKDSETGEQIVIRDNLQESSDSLETVITPNADFSGLKQAFEKYISFIDISSITWLTTAISSMITIFVPFVALGIIIFLINRILNGGS